MNSIELIYERTRLRNSKVAIVDGNSVTTYEGFVDQVEYWLEVFEKNRIGSGTVVGFIGEFTFRTCTLMWALVLRNTIVVPFSPTNLVEQRKLYEICGIEVLITFGNAFTWHIEKSFTFPSSLMIEEFRRTGKPGLVVFSSGSTGKPKGILHDWEKIANKFITIRHGWVTLLFLMMDHFGGINTFLSSLAYGGTAVCLPDRSPESVCNAIQRSNVTLLPISPTFLNFLIASGCYRKYDLSSVKLVTYGTEVMPETTLKKAVQIFPNADFKQTYGLSEVGVLRSRSRENDSVWLKVGGDGFDVRVEDSVLYIKSESSMVGYLNAPQPFDEDGWFCTGDEVEVNGEYIRIIGRQSDMINVGGQKVFPNEVETVLLEAENVFEASVRGEKHPIMGHVVAADIALHNPEDLSLLKSRLRKHCLSRLAPHKVPVHFRIVDKNTIRSDRFKKRRNIDMAD
jgi:long-chain acyl-CoA synthetase